MIENITEIYYESENGNPPCHSKPGKIKELKINLN